MRLGDEKRQHCENVRAVALLSVLKALCRARCGSVDRQIPKASNLCDSTKRLRAMHGQSDLLARRRANLKKVPRQVTRVRRQLGCFSRQKKHQSWQRVRDLDAVMRLRIVSSNLTPSAI